MANLDRLAARHAQCIIAATLEKGKKEDVENLVTKTLGVLQEQGVYAGFLYLLSRPERERPIARAVRDELTNLMGEPELSSFGLAYGGEKDNGQTLLDHFADTVCAKPLQTLLLVKSLFEQTLTYARYSAKARLDGAAEDDDEEETE